MRYCPRTLQDFVQSHSPFSPAKDALGEFGQSLESYLAGIADSKGESEEHQKNLLRDFLYQSFNYDCNTKDRIDLAIYEDSVPKVLFEVKKSDNAQEFVKPNAQNPNLECKAFYESILYFLRETITNKNNNLTHIVLTNTEDFYIIDAKVYATFAKDKAILKAFKNCEHKEGNDASTKRFYEELNNLLPTLDMEIPYTHFRVEDSILANCHSKLSPCHSETLCHSEPALAGEESQPTNNKESQHILPLLYQILSPHVLLKCKTYLDANTLNQDFYDELLYILGLKEISQSGKVLILPSLSPHTLLDSICSTFELERDKDFEILFSLLTTWNNRLLFLRLLESMLLGFRHIKKPFLNLDCLKDFQALNTLFFDILAKIEENRDSNIPESLSSIPYLNSSLFEKTLLEIEGKEIKLLESKPLTLYHDSILYKDKNFCQSLNLNAQAKDSTLPLLEYLFAFLHAYDFTTTAQDIQNHTKINFDKLINSAVLGLVFEKLNGYKEGSFYTPSFITRYMCKQSLERVVLQKFNESQNWDCQNLDELKNKIDKLTDSKEGYKQANAIFDSIHICDPAVGSGHFLVSALNELILLKFKLGILCDENHHRIKDITLEILRDEIVIRDSQNALFTYTLPAHDNIESHKIQRALFFAKRKLIESCLFGVDINPNSCEITKLRLWIELLKYSYYKDIPNKRLETLPNIDINIKCGNSLISRFNLSDSLRTIPNINFQIEQYKKLVFEYKNADQNLMTISKKDIEKQIETIQATFTLTLKDPKTKRELEKAIESHIKQFNNYLLDDASLLEGLDSLQFNLFGTPTLSEEEQERALESYGKIQALRKKLTLALSGAEYKNAFEWRFAFPEVLDSNGDFLGFDLVIGNPPYIRIQGLNKQISEKYKKSYQTATKNYDIYVLFVEMGLKIAKSNAPINFIMPHKWLNADFGEGLRNLVKNKVAKIIHFGDFQVFKASTYTALHWFNHQAKDLQFIKSPDSIQTEQEMTEFLDSITQDDFRIFPHKDLDSRVWNLVSDKTQNILMKIAQFTPAKDIFHKMFQGIATSKDSVYFLEQCKESSKGLIKGYSKELDLIVEIESDFAKPLLMGSSFHRYEKLESDLRVIFPYFKEVDSKGKEKMSLYSELDLQTHFPKGYAYLKQCEQVLRARENGRFDTDKWYQFGRAQGISEGGITKLLMPYLSIKSQLTYDEKGEFYHNTKVFGLIRNVSYSSLDYKYLLAILNSNLMWWYVTKTASVMRGGYYTYTPTYIENFCIPNLTPKEQKPFIALVDKILTIKANCHSERSEKSLQGNRDVSLSMKAQHDKQDSSCHSEPAAAGEESLGKKSRGSKRDVSGIRPQHDKISDTSTLESEIDSLVYQLYNLTDEEIKIVESK